MPSDVETIENIKRYIYNKLLQTTEARLNQSKYNFDCSAPCLPPFFLGSMDLVAQ